MLLKQGSKRRQGIKEIANTTIERHREFPGTAEGKFRGKNYVTGQGEKNKNQLVLDQEDKEFKDAIITRKT